MATRSTLCEAYSGLDKIRGQNGQPLVKSWSGWSVWADRQAKLKTEQTGVKWFASFFRRDDGCLRISFAGK